ncbi:MAG: cupin domain-containing protein [Armatimonadota bacterium]
MKVPPGIKAIHPDTVVSTRQGLSMHLVVIPPGGRAQPHTHIGYETAIYVLEGRVRTHWGSRLENDVVSEAGDFLFIPPGVPHEAINLSATEAARAIVARNDPADQDRVELYTVPTD